MHLNNINNNNNTDQHIIPRQLYTKQEYVWRTEYITSLKWFRLMRYPFIIQLNS